MRFDCASVWFLFLESKKTHWEITKGIMSAHFLVIKMGLLSRTSLLEKLAYTVTSFYRQPKRSPEKTFLSLEKSCGFQIKIPLIHFQTLEFSGIPHLLKTWQHIKDFPIRKCFSFSKIYTPFEDKLPK